MRSHGYLSPITLLLNNQKSLTTAAVWTVPANCTNSHSHTTSSLLHAVIWLIISPLNKAVADQDKEPMPTRL